MFPTSFAPRHRAVGAKQGHGPVGFGLAHEEGQMQACRPDAERRRIDAGRQRLGIEDHPIRASPGPPLSA